MVAAVMVVVNSKRLVRYFTVTFTNKPAMTASIFLVVLYVSYAFLKLVDSVDE